MDPAFTGYSVDLSYAVQVSENWYAGLIDDSRYSVDGRQESLGSLYAAGGNGQGRYRIITTSYLDAEGEQTDANDNIKEILSMVSVKTLNTWPDTWDLIDLPWGKDKWTVSELKTMIRCLYQATHSWEAEEKGPYAYYEELGNRMQRILKAGYREQYRVSYPGSAYMDKALLGDTEGEGCESAREFFCTETDAPDTASPYRTEMADSYRGRGGCEVDYTGYGKYNAADDTFTLTGGSLHNGQTVIQDAHEQVWATDDMKQRYELACRYAADPSIDDAGDELRKRHEDALSSPDPPAGCSDYTKIPTGTTLHEHISYDFPAPGCEHYEKTFEGYRHGSSMDTVPSGCGNYSMQTSYGLPVYGPVSGWGSDVWYWWNDTAGRYEAALNDTTYVLDATAYRYYTGRSYIHFTYNSLHNCYVPNDTAFQCRDEIYRYTCLDDLYDYSCNEQTAYCDGNHQQFVTIYYCPGHKEYWCSKNHYDLDVRIRVSHIPESFQKDADNSYRYKRTSGVGSCGDYACMFRDLCLAAGISCRCVYGTIGDDPQIHVWDYVCVDGKWYYCDPAWNDGGSDEYPYMFSEQLWKGRKEKF